MEGPPVRVIAEKLATFKGEKVISATGNAKIDKNGIPANEIADVFSRGKNLFIKLADFSIKIHFLMYGSYRINEEKEGAKPRLSLVFKSGVVNFYHCSVRLVSNEDVAELYDEELDKERGSFHGKDSSFKYCGKNSRRKTKRGYS
jgi:endonuclease-8